MKTDHSPIIRGVEQRAFAVEEVGGMLSVSRSTVFRLIAAGELESIKVGGSRRVTREQLDRYLGVAG